MLIFLLREARALSLLREVPRGKVDYELVLDGGPGSHGVSTAVRIQAKTWTLDVRKPDWQKTRACIQARHCAAAFSFVSDFVNPLQGGASASLLLHCLGNFEALFRGWQTLAKERPRSN